MTDDNDKKYKDYTFGEFSKKKDNKESFYNIPKESFDDIKTNNEEVHKKSEDKVLRKKVVDYSIKEDELLPLFSFVPDLLYCVAHLKFWTIQFKYDDLKNLLSKRNISLDFYKKELDKFTTIDDIVKIYANDPETLNELLKKFIAIFNAATVLQLKIKPFDDNMALDLSKNSSLTKSLLDRIEK